MFYSCDIASILKEGLSVHTIGGLAISNVSPSYNHMEKADFEFEALNGINVIMFQNSSVTFSTKIRKKNKVRF